MNDTVQKMKYRAYGGQDLQKMRTQWNTTVGHGANELKICFFKNPKYIFFKNSKSRRKTKTATAELCFCRFIQMDINAFFMQIKLILCNRYMWPKLYTQFIPFRAKNLLQYLSVLQIQSFTYQLSQIGAHLCKYASVVQQWSKPGSGAGSVHMESIYLQTLYLH